MDANHEGRSWVTICATCKRVQVAAQDWLVPEAYLADHIGMRVQHSLCLRCAPDPAPGNHQLASLEPGAVALCPRCKWVRHGPYGWAALAGFLRERIVVRVVHGVCDPCLARL